MLRSKNRGIYFLFLLGARILAAQDFLYFTAENRSQALDSMADYVEANYALADLKKATLGVDLASDLGIAAKDELSISEARRGLPQAEANLSFFSRARKVLARARDSHIKIDSPNSFPTVFLPIKIVRIADKYYVRMVWDEVLAGGGLTNAIRLGDEVISVDGKAPGQLASELGQYIIKSSVPEREFWSITAITRRDFLYPSRGISDWIIQSPGGTPRTVKLPWLYKYNTRADARLLFKDRGIQLLADFLRESNATSNGPAYTGTMDLPTVPNLSNSKTLTDTVAHDTHDFGYVTIGETRAAYARLVSMRPEATTSDDQRVSVVDSLKDLVLSAKLYKLPLILDLRMNFGGTLSGEIMELLLSQGQRLRDITNILRITPTILQQIEKQIASQRYSPEHYYSVYPNELPDLLSAGTTALLASDTYSRPVSRGWIESSKAVGGYDQKVVVWVSELCMSDCELFAALAKQIPERFTLIGSTTAGASAGFYGIDGYNDEFTDRNSLLTTKFPLYLVGKPADVENSQKRNDELVRELTLENVGVVPDVPHQSPLEDWLKDEANSWLQISEKYLH